MESKKIQNAPVPVLVLQVAVLVRVVDSALHATGAGVDVGKHAVMLLLLQFRHFALLNWSRAVVAAAVKGSVPT